MRSRSLPILVAIETDPTRYHGEQPSRPAPLDRSGAERLLAHIASDLGSLFSDADRCRLTLSGALYDASQLLRPGFPVFRALDTLARERPGESGYRPGLLSIGAAEGRMPLPELEPDSALPPGILQLLALTLSGPEELVQALEDEAEHRFMEEGQLSAHTAKALEADFAIGLVHARFMTLTDLEAMLRMQLEHFGFLPLWELLQAALDDDPDGLEVQGAEGQRFRWEGGAVTASFETFDHWATTGAGADFAPDDPAELARDYATWTRGWRQYLVTLEAHGIDVRIQSPGAEGTPLQGAFLAESSDQPVHPLDATVTEHGSDELGTLAVSVIENGALLNYYPLNAAGLNELHRHIRPRAAGGAVSFPGEVLIDPKSRRLRPDRLDDAASPEAAPA